MTTQQLSDTVGMYQGNLSKIENGRTWIGKDKLVALAEALEVPVAVLFEDDEEPALRHESESRVPAIGTNRLPVWDYAAAGSFVYSSPAGIRTKSELPKGQRFLLTDQDYSKNSFALRVSDDAMAPLFTHGMVAIVDPEKKPKPNSVVAVLMHGNSQDEVVLRYYHDRGTKQGDMPKFEAVPKNRAYRTFSSENDEISLVGVVMEQRQYWE